MSDIKKTANKVRSKLKSESGRHPGLVWEVGGTWAHFLRLPWLSPTPRGTLGLAFLCEGAVMCPFSQPLAGKACSGQAWGWASGQPPEASVRGCSTLGIVPCFS